MTKASQSKNPLSALHHRVQELEANWKRAVADYQNLEKRISSQQADFVRFANAGLLDKLLTILDDLERAQAHNPDTGLNLILTQFKDILKTEGVAEIEALGQPFNPQTMDAIDMVAGPKNQVIKVITKGYTLNSKVLRPAKVQVGKGELKPETKQ